MRSDLPTGTVTFLFTDVEGSTKLLRELGASRYAEALAEHRGVIREACAAHGGVEVDTQGDAFFFAFPTAPGALAAAEAMTDALAAGPIQVRIGLHTGTPLLTDEGYVGGDVHRAARIAAVGFGGQVLVSASTAQLVEQELTDLGEHRLKDLSAPERLFQLGGGVFPPLKSLYRTNLPVPATPFLGREREVAEVVSLLNDARLLTLTGPGGTGKTRLALQAVAAATDSFPDGVFWVSLAALRDPELVLPSAAQALEAKSDLDSHIADKRLLLLLDNFEQVVEAAPQLGILLASCPNLLVMVTSRELLRLAGELEYPVPPLAEREAVELFCARSQLEADDAIAELCRRLDNLPLAVELAAARTSVLTPAQILERLSQRLDLLKGGRDAEARQRTLRATVEWSRELLSASEQQLFSRLSVFAGGCTLEAAEEVADADLDTLQSLVDKSLLRFTDGRYWMLETIREYANQLLMSTPDVARLAQAHARYFLALAQAAEQTTGTAQAEWLARLDADHDNFRAAIDWSLQSGQHEIGLRIAVALRPFWEVRGHIREAKQYLLHLNEPDQPPELRALALRDLFFVTAVLNELDEAERYAHERQALCLSLGDEDGASRALQNLAVVAEQRGDLDRAKTLYEGLLASSRERSVEVGMNLGILARIAWRQGRLTDAEALTEEALAELEAANDSAEIAHAWTQLAAIRLYQGRREHALPLLARSLQLNQELRSPRGLARDLATTALASTDAETAGRLLGKAEELRLEAEARVPSAGDFGPHALAAAGVRDALGQEGLDVARARGQAMSLDDALALALDSLD